MTPFWLLRMAKWARNPPSPRQVKGVLVVIAICLVIALIEYLGWWPDWATADRMRPAFPLRP